MIRTEGARGGDKPIQVIVGEKPGGSEEGVCDALDVADIVVVVGEVLEASARAGGCVIKK